MNNEITTVSVTDILTTGDVSSVSSYASGVFTLDTLIADSVITSKLLTGYTYGTNYPVQNYDTILSAFGNLQAQITERMPTVSGVNGDVGIVQNDGTYSPNVRGYNQLRFTINPGVSTLLNVGDIASGSSKLQISAQTGYAAELTMWANGGPVYKFSTGSGGNLTLTYQADPILAFSYTNTNFYLYNGTNVLTLDYYNGMTVRSNLTVTTLGTGMVKSTSGLLSNAVAGTDYISPSGLTTALAGYQPLDGDLTSIAAISATTGLLRKTAANTWSLDTSAYLTANQTITLSGDVTGSGATTIATSISSSVVSSKLLTGYVIGTNTAIAATDSIIGAFGKVQAQINTSISNVSGVANQIAFFNGTNSVIGHVNLTFDGTDTVNLGSTTSSVSLNPRLNINQYSGTAGGGEIYLGSAGAAGDENSGKLMAGGFRIIGTTQSLFKLQRLNGAVYTSVMEFTSLSTTDLGLKFSGLITGTAGITSAGTITFSSLSTGLVKSTAGVLSNAVVGTDFVGFSSANTGVDTITWTKIVTATSTGAYQWFEIMVDVANRRGSLSASINVSTSSTELVGDGNLVISGAMDDYTSVTPPFILIKSNDGTHTIFDLYFKGRDFARNLNIMYRNKQIQGFTITYPNTATAVDPGASNVSVAMYADNTITRNINVTNGAVEIVGVDAITSARAGNLTDLISGVAHVGNWSGTATYARFGHSSFNLTNGFGFLQTNAGQIYMDAATGTSILSRINGSVVLTTASTGNTLAGTTTLSALGTGMVKSTAGVLSNLTGTNIVLADGTTLPQSTYTLASGGPYLPLIGGILSGNLTFSDDGEGVFFNSGAGIYKKSGTGIVMRLHTANTNVQIENNAGTILGSVWYGTGGTLNNLSQLTNGPGYITSSSIAIPQGRLAYGNATSSGLTSSSNLIYDEKTLFITNPSTTQGLFLATASTTNAALVGNWAGSAFWGLGEHDSTTLKFQSCSNTGFWSSYALNLHIPNGNISLSGAVYPTGGCILNQYGTSGMFNGNADSATYSAYNLKIKSWWGIGFESYDGATRTLLDTRTGNFSTQGYVGAGGLAAIGASPSGAGANYGVFAHSSYLNTTGYALAQGASGSVWLNAASGQGIDLSINNGASLFKVTASQITASVLFRVNSPAEFAYTSYGDPLTGYARDAKFGYYGIAVAGTSSTTGTDVSSVTYSNIPIVMQGARSALFRKDYVSGYGYPLIVGNWSTAGFFGVGNKDGSSTIKIGRVDGNLLWSGTGGTMLEVDSLNIISGGTLYTTNISGGSALTLITFDSIVKVSEGIGFSHITHSGSGTLTKPGVVSVLANSTIVLPTPSASTLGWIIWIVNTGSYTTNISGGTIIGNTPGMTGTTMQQFTCCQTGGSSYAWMCK